MDIKNFYNNNKISILIGITICSILILIFGCIFLPKIFYDQFIWRFFWGPIITDAMGGVFVSKTDAVIIGADAVLKNGNVINKSGSFSLALFCKYYKKPFYVLTTKSKFIKKIRFDITDDSSEIVWKYKHPKLKLANIPFEEIDNKFISGIISEK